MGNHALLSASSSHRWLNCPPSARLGENYEDRGSDFAAEGTDAHSLCEYRLKQALGMDAESVTLGYGYENPVYVLQSGDTTLLLDYDTLELVDERELSSDE